MSSGEQNSQRKAIAVISACDEIVKQYLDTADGLVDEAPDAIDPVVALFARGFRFGLLTLRGMSVLIDSDEDNVLLACTLSRPFYEMSLRFLWASRVEKGWTRLACDWTDSDIKWCREAERLGIDVEYVQNVRASREKVREQVGCEEDSIQRLPKVAQILREIEEVGVAEQLPDAGATNAAFDYTFVYRLLCEPAHAHLSSIARPRAFGILARQVPVWATMHMVQAYWGTFSENAETEIENALRPLLDAYRESYD